MAYVDSTQVRPAELSISTTKVRHKRHEDRDDLVRGPLSDCCSEGAALLAGAADAEAGRYLLERIEQQRTRSRPVSVPGGPEAPGRSGGRRDDETKTGGEARPRGSESLGGF